MRSVFPSKTAAYVLFACLSAVFATLSHAASSTTSLTIYTVNYPLQYFAERIGGDRVEVHFPAPQAVDPAFWVPDAATVLDYQQADLILLNGADYAGWVNKVSLPRLRTVNTSSGFSDQLITERGAVTHSHGPAGEHSHAGTAFTTWLDFTQALRQAEAVLAAMQRLRPEHGEYFAGNFNTLKQDLQSLDAEMLSVADRLAGRGLFASHPVYQYLARRYGLDLYALTWEPDVFPEPGQWQQLAGLQRREARGWMLWEAEPRAETERRLARMGIEIVVFFPAMKRPLAGDFLGVMKSNVKALENAVGAGG